MKLGLSLAGGEIKGMAHIGAISFYILFFINFIFNFFLNI